MVGRSRRFRDLQRELCGQEEGGSGWDDSMAVKGRGEVVEGGQDLILLGD